MLPRLHLVTDDAVLGADGFPRVAESLLRTGGPRLAFHLRGPRTSGSQLFELASRLTDIAREAGALLLVNERVDVALASGASGVHLGARGMRLRDARVLVGSQRCIGASVHCAEEGAVAVSESADYLLAGTLFRSASHPERPGSGTGWIGRASALGVPVVGIGGITPERVPEVRSAGAWGVAVLSAVWAAERPVEAVQKLIASVEHDA